MIVTIGKGTFDVRLSARLLWAWARWKIWPDYDNLHRLGLEIRAHELHPRHPLDPRRKELP
jgi:hypothetical protein